MFKSHHPIKYKWQLECPAAFGCELNNCNNANSISKCPKPWYQFLPMFYTTVLCCSTSVNSHSSNYMNDPLLHSLACTMPDPSTQIPCIAAVVPAQTLSSNDPHNIPPTALFNPGSTHSLIHLHTTLRKHPYTYMYDCMSCRVIFDLIDIVTQYAWFFNAEGYRGYGYARQGAQ